MAEKASSALGRSDAAGFIDACQALSGQLGKQWREERVPPRERLERESRAELLRILRALGGY
jgi:hypothetical protein